MDERVKRWEYGIDKAYTWGELEASIEQLKILDTWEWYEEIQFDLGDHFLKKVSAKVTSVTKKLLKILPIVTSFLVFLFKARQ